MSVSLAERNQERRRVITRLFSLFTGLIILVVTLPVVIVQALPWTTAAVLLLIAGLGFSGVALAERGLATIPAAVFALGGVAGATTFALVIGRITVPVLTGFITFPLFILIAGLILSPRLLGLTTALCMAVTGTLFAVLPPSSVFVTAQVQIGLGFQLVSLQALAALLSWIAARSADAGIREAEGAFQRERALAQMQEQFITDANHELRTPIMAWFTSTELLTQQDAILTPERRHRLLTRSLRSGEQVLRLMESLLDAGVLSAQNTQVQVAELDLAMVIRETVEALDPATVGEVGLQMAMMAERDIHLHLAAKVMVRADAVRVRQVLTNLLTNAMKYSDPGTPLIITTELHQGPGELRVAQVMVRDQGWGIPPAEANHVFDRFVRLDRDLASAVRGTGIGLYLCRTLVGAMGGRIWVESSGVRGEGSTFTFTLPLAEDGSSSHG